MDAATRAHELRRSLEAVVGVPATEGNRITVLRNGCEIFPAMLESIRAAERSIDLATFVYWTGEIAEKFASALSQRAGNGVRVRVLLDAVGARRMNHGLVDRMTANGVDVRFFRPVGDTPITDATHRTHRKILVCDESVGFTGGVGIAEEWMGDARSSDEWRDTHFRIEGPAVDGLKAAFIDNWIETCDELEVDETDRFPLHHDAGTSTVQVVTASAATEMSAVATAFEAALTLARDRVLITTAYFNPDERTTQLIAETSERGVDVEVLVPGPHADKRVVQLAGEEVYDTLLDAGVGIFAYQPTMLHAKIITVDRALAVVGSANVNSRSMAHDDEIVVNIFDPDVVGELDDQRREDLRRSEPIDLEEWRDRGLVQRALEKATSVLDSHF